MYSYWTETNKINYNQVINISLIVSYALFPYALYTYNFYEYSEYYYQSINV
jgi:hypothetical protein